MLMSLTVPDAGRALELAGLSGLERRVDRLSAGQVQRAKFALVAVADPEVMLVVFAYESGLV
jgi:energy-coupling factor transporter ATP-binding protein EcfA2